MSYQIRTLLIVILLLLVPTTIVVASESIDVLFTEPQSQVSYETTEIEEEIIQLIDNAQSTIHIAVYDIRRISLRDALTNALDRGVTVALAADYQEYNEPDCNTDVYWDSCDTFIWLEERGATVSVSSYQSYLQHNKYMIVDGEYLVTGSTNWTDTGFTKNANNTLFIQSADVAQVYEAEFSQMMAGNFANEKDDVSDSVTVAGIDLNIYFSPNRGVAKYALLDAIYSAEESILFSAFFFTDEDISNALIARALDGVSVYGVMDELGASNAYSKDETLCLSNTSIDVRIEEYSGKVHNKLMVIDQKTVATGSYNWTQSGAFQNDENMLVFTDGILGLEYHTYIQSQYDGISADRGCESPVEPTPTIPPIRSAVYAIYLPLVQKDEIKPTPTPMPTATPEIPPTVIPTHTPVPTSIPENPEPTAAPSCEPSYPDVCIPLKSEVGDLNCGDIPYKNFTVLQPDPHRFDGNKDGVGCES